MFANGLCVHFALNTLLEMCLKQMSEIKVQDPYATNKTHYKKFEIETHTNQARLHKYIVGDWSRLHQICITYTNVGISLNVFKLLSSPTFELVSYIKLWSLLNCKHQRCAVGRAFYLIIYYLVSRRQHRPPGPPFWILNAWCGVKANTASTRTGTTPHF